MLTSGQSAALVWGEKIKYGRGARETGQQNMTGQEDMYKTMTKEKALEHEEKSEIKRRMTMRV